ncbi:hypothetical protein BBJ29_001647 [Phytophthora kernoviae]|uniref:Chloride channel protein n=1 Tax=Phytophthora kernoviae TaxID=325452 RepID=A0A3F2RRU8_9STRA|nr:hypothetical protein BBP00_00004410 [Phytophthora kernoviae]RLN71094.1 hypothetical protein BBJ29_001647 [Phytophthora kernoviae]
MLWKSSDLESLDYDLFESVVNKSGMGYTYRNGQEKNRLIYARWFLTLVTGVITALVAVFMLYFTTLLLSLKQHLLEYTIQHELAKNVLFGTTFWTIVGFNAFLAAIAATVTSFGEPVAAGSGISEVKTTLNGMKIPRLLRLRTFVCKVIGTVCSVAGGLPVGKEGPMIHSGAIVAAGLSQGKSSTLGYDTSFSYFAGFRNDKEKRDFVACGAAAGVASAFGAPIGGVLFVLEEATFTLAFFLSGMNDNLSWGAAGATATVPSKALVFGMEMLNKNGSACICESCSTVSMDGAECFQADDSVQYPYKKELLRFYCPKGQYNDLASLMLTSGEVAIKHLFHAPPDSFDVQNLVVFWVVMLFLACITYGLKVPSGLFVPALLIGAAYGRLWTRVINYFTGLRHMKSVDPRTYGLVGSLAMLGGVSRMTISITIIILECTGNIEFGLPLILTSFFARWVGNYFNEGIYDIHIHLRHVPFLDWNSPLRGSFLRVKHIMTAHPKTLRTVERAGVIFDLLVSTKHNAFPVIVEDPTFGSRFFAGIILRKQLNVLLSYHDFTVEKPKPFSRQPHPASYEPSVTTNNNVRRRHSAMRDLEANDTPRVDDKLLQSPLASNYCLSYHDMEAHYPRYPIPTPLQHDFLAAAHVGHVNGDELYTLSEEDRTLWVDLTPYMNQTPYVIQEEAPFVRAYRLFRSGGLRHLIVVNRHNNVRGIITRRELEEEHCARCFRLAKNIVVDDAYPLSRPPPVGFLRKLHRTVSRTEQVKRALSNSVPILRDVDDDGDEGGL